MNNPENNKNYPKKWLGVFCGAYTGTDETVHALVKELGGALALNEIGLVYGGGGNGVMGSIADAVLENNGWVMGVVPKNLLETEMAHTSLDELVIVESMHERKKTMYEKADAFCALPGGLGTLEEIFEAATWTKLKLHEKYKSVMLLDNNGFWLSFIDLIDDITSSGFIKPEDRAIISRFDSVSAIISNFKNS
jgi:hypothetical protein